MENWIGTHVLKDVIRLYPAYMLDNGNPEITVSEGRVCVIRDDWKITFYGDGIVRLQKGDNDEHMYDDHSYGGKPNVLFCMMQDYERDLLRHETVVKYKAKRDEIWDAAEKLRDAGAIGQEALEKIRENFGLRWVFKQAKRELYGEE